MGNTSFRCCVLNCQKIIQAILALSLLTSCAVLDFPDAQHEEIYNQIDNQMSNDIQFGRR